jgi:polar amino acid transport system substrate-binding protein
LPTPDANIIGLAKVTDIVNELISGKLEGAFIETAVAEQYAKNYPDLCVVLPVPYDAEGSVVGVNKGNEALLAGVNEAIKQCIDEGLMEDWVAEANELATGDIIEGMIEE